MPDKIPFTIANYGRLVGLSIDRKACTVGTRERRVDARGAVALAEVESADSKHRVGAGIVGGVVFLPLALVAVSKKHKVTLRITVTAANGEKVEKTVKGGKREHENARLFVDQFNAWSGQSSSSAGASR